MKPYFVTGGCGFVGRNLVKRLLREGNEVWVVDNLFTGLMPDKWLEGAFTISQHKRGIKLYSNKRSKLYFIKADLIELLEKELHVKVLPRFSDTFHLASVVGGRALIDGDPLLVSRDMAIDAIFFTWLTRDKKLTDRLMYASSSAAYPVVLQGKSAQRLKENMISFSDYLGVPDMTYGWSKLTGEFLSRLAYTHYGVNTCCVRPFSGYGEDQESVYPIPAIARRVAKSENPIDVWGTGKQARDFVHIDDCITAFFIAMDKIKDGSAVNISSGKLTSFIEIIDLFCRIKGYRPKINKLLDKPVGVANRYGDNTKLKGLGWKPVVQLEEGLRKVLNRQVDLLK